MAASASAQFGRLTDAQTTATKPNPAQSSAKPDTGASQTKTSTPASKRFEKEGIVVDFSVKPLAGGGAKDEALVAGTDALATLRVTDAHTGQPVTGLHPNVWINSRKTESVPTEAECKDKIRTYLGGLLSARADYDLNSYLLLTLNHDNTISFINPQVSFSLTKLESLITLPGSGADWTLAKNKELLYVTLPDQSAVAVVNTVTRKLVSTIPTGEKTKPRRIALEPDGRLAWVGLDDSPLVAVIDTATNKLAATINVGSGLHNIAFTADSRLAYVTNSAADTVSAISTETLKKVADIKVGQTPVAIAYSSASRAVYVAAINGASVSAIDTSTQQVVATIPTKRGVVALRFEPTGRFGFAVNQRESTVSIFDSSTNALVDSSQVVKEPDQVVFTRGFAYIRSTASEKFSLIDLNGLGKQKLSITDLQAGQKPPSALPEEIGVADMIAPTPEGNSVMIANTPDENIYYYVEGMMAPMGTFQNYKRRPHALLLIDRSLQETAPGVYSTPVRLQTAGRFDVPVLIDQLRISNCFQLEVGESAQGEKSRTGASIVVQEMFSGGQFKAGETATLRFKITDAATKQPVVGLKDVRVLIFEPPGIWQQRQFAKELGDGVYEITQVFPHSGFFDVMFNVPSRGLSLTASPVTHVKVIDGAAQRDKEVK
jgi:YVTN family beta-propeller protein